MLYILFNCSAIYIIVHRPLIFISKDYKSIQCVHDKTNSWNETGDKFPKILLWYYDLQWNFFLLWNL